MLSARELLLKKQIQSMPDLPSLSIHVLQLIRLLGAAEVDMQAVFAAIRKDPTMVTRMLKVINSSLYSLPRRIETVEQAVTLLGVKKIKELVLSSAVMDVIQSRDATLWEHSFSTATLVAEVVRKHRIQVSPVLGLCALLHDIGQLVLSIFNAEGMKLAIIKAKSDELADYDAERQVIGCDHAQVGGWLLENWKLDEEIRTVIGAHHAPHPPREVLREILLLRFCDAVDEAVRGKAVVVPERDDLAVVGLDMLEFDEWADYQSKILSSEQK
ncbi:MAG: hypothetical protein RL095_2741 [Verrucomicrobiota bacterium]|jgi:putative nucleotidyltransferase with HDIG domain